MLGRVFATCVWLQSLSYIPITLVLCYRFRHTECTVFIVLKQILWCSMKDFQWYLSFGTSQQDTLLLQYLRKNFCFYSFFFLNTFSKNLLIYNCYAIFRNGKIKHPMIPKLEGKKTNFFGYFFDSGKSMWMHFILWIIVELFFTVLFVLH